MENINKQYLNGKSVIEWTVFDKVYLHAESTGCPEIDQKLKSSRYQSPVHSL